MISRGSRSQVRWILFALVIVVALAIVTFSPRHGRRVTGQGGGTPTVEVWVTIAPNLMNNQSILAIPEGTRTAWAADPTPLPLEQPGIPITSAARAEELARNNLPASATVTAVSVSRLDYAELEAWSVGGAPADYAIEAAESGQGSAWVVAFLLDGVTAEEIMGDPPASNLTYTAIGAYYGFDANHGSNHRLGVLVPAAHPYFAGLTALPTSSASIVTASPMPLAPEWPSPTPTGSVP